MGSFRRFREKNIMTQMNPTRKFLHKQTAIPLILTAKKLLQIAAFLQKGQPFPIHILLKIGKPFLPILVQQGK